jgi:hypothetical protein
MVFLITHPFRIYYLIVNLLEIVVFVAITPAIFVAATISMSSNCSSVKSGAILSKIGFALA